MYRKIIEMDLQIYFSSHRGKSLSQNKIQQLFPVEYKDIIKIDGESFAEKVFCFLNNISDHPCPICGKPTKFISFGRGYATYCSQKCAANANSTKSKRAQTNKNKYGKENVSQVENVKEKRKSTMVDRYGVEYALQSKKFQDKFKQTTLDRYGVENPSQSDEIRLKKEQTCLMNHGVTNILKIENIRRMGLEVYKEKFGQHGIWSIEGMLDRIKESRKKNLINKHKGLIDITKDGWIFGCPHPSCTKCQEKIYITQRGIYHDRKRGGYEQCTILSPIGHMNQNTGIESLVRSWLDENNITYITNSKSILKKYELDIYIPDKKIAIECNGVYWHCDKNKPAWYHKSKHIYCKNSDILLLQFWEDQICNKPEIVKSVILSKLGIYKRRTYARLCTIKEISPTLCGDFLQNNHIQGKTGTKVRLGAYLNDELVGVMTFIQSKGCQGTKQKIEGQWELNRFCTLINTQVIGLADKMLKFFIRNYSPKSIISFSHNDISRGDVYEKLGFKSNGKINQSYYYIDHHTMHRYHRSTFTKASIIRRGWAPENENWTEHQVMDEHEFLRIYDSGTQKWTLYIK